MSRALVPLLLIGCNSYEAEEFATDYADAVCTLWDSCALIEVTDTYESVDDCLEQVEGSVDPEACEFNEEKAQECVDAVNAMVCDDLYDEVWPDACDYACP